MVVTRCWMGSRPTAVAVAQCIGQGVLPKPALPVAVVRSVEQGLIATVLLAHKALRAAMPRPPCLAAQRVVVVVQAVRVAISPEPQVVLVVMA